MTVKAKDAKVTASLVKENIAHLEKYVEFSKKAPSDNPLIVKEVAIAEAKLEMLRDVYDSLNGNHTLLRIAVGL